MTEKYSPLDMKPTIDWYAENSIELQRKMAAVPRLAKNYSKPVFTKEAIGLSKDYIRRVLRSFPQEALDRSILEKILLKPALWFDKGSEEKQNPTPNINEALSPTALIPSYTSYKGWTPEKPTATVELYQIPIQIAGGRDIARIVLTEGLIHELGHTIIAPAQFTDGELILPNGEIITHEKTIGRFADLAEKQEPISHYASGFRNPDKTFIDTKDKPLTTSISEELAESIAAYFLGFAYSDDKQRRLNPFVDRPEIKQFVHDFLHARKK